MGLPGLKRCLDSLGEIYCKRMHYPSSRVYVDGNILLYIVKEINEVVTVDAFMRLILEIEQYFMDDKIVASGEGDVFFIITFDGVAPYQKLPEQISRRKKRLEETTITSPDYFDLGNQVFRTMLAELEEKLVANSWHVISHALEGEGEQKLANRISKDILHHDEHNIIMISKDWDTVMILLSIEPLRTRLYLYMLYSLPLFMNRIIDIRLLRKRITAICPVSHYMASVLLFGCDFIPGINNIELHPRILNKLIYMPEWIQLDDNTCLLSVKRFIDALSILQEHRKELLKERNKDIQPFVLYNNIGVPSKLEAKNQSSDSLSDGQQYREIDTTTTECTSICPTCHPEHYTPNESKEDITNHFLNTYMWTILYFSNRNVRVRITPLHEHNDEVVYSWHIAPHCKTLKRCMLSSANMDCIDKLHYQFTMTEIEVIPYTTYCNLVSKAVRRKELFQKECEFNPTLHLKPKLLGNVLDKT